MREVRQIGKAPRQAISIATASAAGEDSLVQQQFKDEVDVNVIVRRFGGAPPDISGEPGIYCDLTGITDFESARRVIEHAQAQFMELPAETRRRFKNDVGRLLAEASDMDDQELDEFNAELRKTPVAPADGAPAPAESAQPVPPSVSTASDSPSPGKTGA